IGLEPMCHLVAAQMIGRAVIVDRGSPRRAADCHCRANGPRHHYESHNRSSSSKRTPTPCGPALATPSARPCTDNYEPLLEVGKRLGDKQPAAQDAHTAQSLQINRRSSPILPSPVKRTP